MFEAACSFHVRKLPLVRDIRSSVVPWSRIPRPGRGVGGPSPIGVQVLQLKGKSIKDKTHHSTKLHWNANMEKKWWLGNGVPRGSKSPVLRLIRRSRGTGDQVKAYLISLSISVHGSFQPTCHEKFPGTTTHDPTWTVNPVCPWHRNGLHIPTPFINCLFGSYRWRIRKKIKY